MKIINQWRDERNNISNYLYEAPNGVKLLSAVNPVTTDVYISVAFRAGSCFEPIIGVPHGTAHFLEHFLDNPNDVFKTRKAIEEFEYGDKQHPSLTVNAGTSKKYIYLYGYCNERGLERLLKRLQSAIQYPPELFKKYIDEERKIILAEMMQEPKPEKDRDLSYDAFSPGAQLPEFVHRIIGTYEEVKNMTVADLEKYYQHMIGDKHAIFSAQTREMLSPDVLQWFEDVAVSLPKLPRVVESPVEDLHNFHDYHYFHDDHEEGVFISFGYYHRIPSKIDYRRRVLFLMMADLLNKLSYDILREKKGLIYGFDLNVRRTHAYNHEMYGFTCNVEVGKAAVALDAIHDLLYSDLMKFLRSKSAEKWFESVISAFIFPHTSSYDSEYAEFRSTDIFEGRDVYIHSKSVEAAKSIVLKDVVDYVEQEFIDVPPHIWVCASLPEAEMEAILKNSKVHRKWGNTSK